MSRAALFVLAFLADLAVGGGVAAAQDGARWAVISASVAANEARPALLESSVAALSASGELVIPLSQATQRVERAVSAPYRPAPRELVARIGQAAETVLNDVAFGRNAQALESGGALVAEAEPYLAALGRDDQAATDLGNVCLYLVRARLASRDEAAAVSQVRDCLRLVPDVGADARLHPPDVRELLSRERQALDGGPVLVVQAAAGEQEGCAVRVQGRALGATPTLRRPVPPGDYAVDVSCQPDVPARIHQIDVGGQGPTRVVVRPRLDSVLQSRPAVSLRYEGSDDLAATLADDVGVLGGALGVDRVLVLVDDGSRKTVRAFSVAGAGPGQLTGWAVVNEPVEEGESRAAVAAALSGQLPDEGPGPGGNDAVAAPRASHTGRRAAGWVLSGVGLVGLGASWAFWARLQDRDDAFRIANPMLPGYGEAQDDVDSARIPVAVTGAVGGALATVGLPLLLPDREGVPWWSWVLGVAGVGLATGGVVLLASDGECIDAPCTRREQKPLLGGLLVSHAAPLMTIPLVYLVRAARSAPTASAWLTPTSGGARLHVRLSL